MNGMKVRVAIDIDHADGKIPAGTAIEVCYVCQAIRGIYAKHPSPPHRTFFVKEDDLESAEVGG